MNIQWWHFSVDLYPLSGLLIRHNGIWEPASQSSIIMHYGLYIIFRRIISGSPIELKNFLANYIKPWSHLFIRVYSKFCFRPQKNQPFEIDLINLYIEQLQSSRHQYTHLCLVVDAHVRDQWNEESEIIFNFMNLREVPWGSSKPHAYTDMWHWLFRWLFELS